MFIKDIMDKQRQKATTSLPPTELVQSACHDLQSVQDFIKMTTQDMSWSFFYAVSAYLSNFFNNKKSPRTSSTQTIFFSVSELQDLFYLIQVVLFAGEFKQFASFFKRTVAKSVPNVRGITIMKAIITKYHKELHIAQQLAEVYCISKAAIYTYSKLPFIMEGIGIESINATSGQIIFAAAVVTPFSMKLYKWVLHNLCTIGWLAIFVVIGVTMLENYLNCQPVFSFTAVLLKKVGLEFTVCILHHPDRKLILISEKLKEIKTSLNVIL